MTVYTNTSGAVVTYTKPAASDIVDQNPLVTCSPASGSTFTQGQTTVTCTANDASANVSAAGTFKVMVNVLGTTFRQPIDGSPVMNVAKLGRVIPVKINVSLNGATIGANAGPISLGGATVVNCNAEPTVDDIEVYAAGSSNTSNQFRWDTAGGFWIYNLDSSSAAIKPSTCYRFNVYYGGTADSTGKVSGGYLAGFFYLKVIK